MIDQLDNLPALLPDTLLQILETGSVTKAANSLKVSQPAVSKAIKTAEKHLGLELVRRECRPLTLTREGQLIAEYAKHSQKEKEKLIQKLRQATKEGSGRVKIASFGASATTHILPRFISNLKKLKPLINVEVLEFNDEQALLALKDGQVDFAIIADKEYPDLDIIPIVTDRLVALVNTEDPLANALQLSAYDLCQRDFILTKGGSAPLVEEWFKRSNTHIVAKHKALQLTSILAMIRANLGVSIVAELSIPQLHNDVSVIPLTPEYPRHICVAKLHGGFASNSAKLTWQYFKEFAARK